MINIFIKLFLTICLYMSLSINMPRDIFSCLPTLTDYYLNIVACKYSITINLIIYRYVAIYK